jgi:hypothetical protein
MRMRMTIIDFPSGFSYMGRRANRITQIVRAIKYSNQIVSARKCFSVSDIEAGVCKNARFCRGFARLLYRFSVIVKSEKMGIGKRASH